MSLLIVSPTFPPDVGGVATYSYEIARNLYKLGKDIVVLTPNSTNAEDIKFDFPVIRTQEQKIRKLRRLSIFSVITPSFIKKYNIKKIFLTTPIQYGLQILLISKFYGISYVCGTHALEILRILPEVQGYRSIKLIGPIILKNAETIFTISNYTYKKIEQIGITKTKIKIFPNGVNPNEFYPLPNSKITALKQTMNLQDRRVLLTISALDVRKGHNVVIKALPKVIKKVPNMIYLIVGSGKNAPYLRRLVKKLELEDYVRFLGKVPYSNLLGLYNICDVFIMLPRYIPSEGNIEGFGIVYLEANACGKPVIAANSGGVPDAVIDGETGILIDPTDINAVARSIIDLLTNSIKADEMGKNGRLRIENNLNWERIVPQMIPYLYQ